MSFDPLAAREPAAGESSNSTEVPGSISMTASPPFIMKPAAGRLGDRLYSRDEVTENGIESRGIGILKDVIWLMPCRTCTARIVELKFSLYLCYLRH